MTGPDFVIITIIVCYTIYNVVWLYFKHLQEKDKKDQ